MQFTLVNCCTNNVMASDTTCAEAFLIKSPLAAYFYAVYIFLYLMNTKVEYNRIAVQNYIFAYSHYTIHATAY